GHDHVELALGGIPAQCIEAGTLVAPSGAANTVILVDLDNLTAHAAGDLAQLALLVGRRLIEGADAKVENGALHRKILSVIGCSGYPTICYKYQSLFGTSNLITELPGFTDF